MVDYIIKGFHLTNSAYRLVLLFITVNLISNLSYKFVDSPWGTLAFFSGVIFCVFYLSLSLISPLILKQPPLSFKQIFTVFKSNFRRTLKSTVVFFSLFFLLMIVTIIAFIILFPNHNSENLFTSNSSPIYAFYIIMTLLSGFTAFMPIYYALENKSIISSTISSVKFSLNHLPFLAIILLPSAVYFLPSIILTNNSMQYTLVEAITLGYVGTFINATALTYYQKNSKS